MDRGLIGQAVSKFIIGFAVTGILIFLPAGTFDYWNAWLLLGVLFIPMLLAGIVMILRNPELLRKRLKMKEEETEQKNVIKISICMFALGFVTAGCNYRFGWILIPEWISWAAAGIFLLAYLLYVEVMRENMYLSRAVEIQEDQKVIDTGLYGIVRHPMYSVTIILFLSMPLILGSVISFVIFLIYPVVLVKRIENEEKVLREGLEGYETYQKKVRYRMIPFIW
ncbi:MAG TPA: isoprenylcysteine carboxylmethyltransferase family protein [Candidatus Anaerostipes avistercoris]|uniref:Isoprenylcysteine carboxylmethyltransferase family protein n=1 Tax=Candidatus Anaerostipes avistercoris TaxID=2838462 RepID=A0A9D2PFG3_9FIRM|nr:isoprenylcysteine carboxylmethyltransferase family protein [Candidatus Anaerostipes avistercoris]